MASIMDNPSYLEQNMKNLLEEIAALKVVGDKVARRKGQKTEGWLKNVESIKREVDGLEKEFNEFKRGSESRRIRDNLNKKVIASLKLAEALKQGGNSISELIESFFSELERDKSKRFSFWELKRYTNDFSTKVTYGFGFVYKGQLTNGLQIAVKKLEDSDVVEEAFIAEVKTMGRTYHRNLARLYGYCFENNMKAVVYEYMENGSFDEVLYENHLNLEWDKLYDIAIGIAKALSYLHEGCFEQIIHHDVRACNVLLDSNLSPRLTDFALAKLMDSELTHLTWTKFRGISGYAAPEMWIPASPISPKCDVYSFGMMLFEILRRKSHIGSKPWFPKQVWLNFKAGQLDEILDECQIEEKNREKAEILSKVALWCSQYISTKRPSMSTVVKMLEMEIPVEDPKDPFPR